MVQLSETFPFSEFISFSFYSFPPERVFEAQKETKSYHFPNFPNFPNSKIAMVEEASASETSVTMAAPNSLETQTSNEATIESNAQGGTESTCNNITLNNNNNAAEGSSEGDREKSLEFAEDLMEKGSKAIKDNDFSEAAECFSRALEIRFRFFSFFLSIYFLLVFLHTPFAYSEVLGFSRVFVPIAEFIS